MIGLDTNVLVRYLTQDDPKQSSRATQVIESMSAQVPGYVTIVVLVELVWVLQGCYNAPRAQIVEVLEQLLRTKEIVLDRAEAVWKAVRVFRQGADDFADCLIERTAAEAGCTHTLTFDRGAVKNCGMKLIG